MVTWVLERDVFPDQHAALSEAVMSAGGSVVWWSDQWWLDERWPSPNGPVIFHGSLENADLIGRELAWKPGVFCSTTRFACSAWWPHTQEHLVTPRYVFSTVADLVESGAPVEFGDRVFVRPDSPLKPFSGRVLDRDQITLRALDHGFYYDDASLPVVVAPAVTVGSEWRFVVSGDSVVAGSDYIAHGRNAGSTISSSHPAWVYADMLAAALVAPDRVYVLDVCETDEGLRLLEVNPFSGADLYGCDRAAVVNAVHALAD